jgi:hypothetical protein
MFMRAECWVLDVDDVRVFCVVVLKHSARELSMHIPCSHSYLGDALQRLIGGFLGMV